MADRLTEAQCGSTAAEVMTEEEREELWRLLLEAANDPGNMGRLGHLANQALLQKQAAIDAERAKVATAWREGVEAVLERVASLKASWRRQGRYDERADDKYVAACTIEAAIRALLSPAAPEMGAQQMANVWSAHSNQLTEAQRATARAEARALAAGALKPGEKER